MTGELLRCQVVRKSKILVITETLSVRPIPHTLPAISVEAQPFLGTVFVLAGVAESLPATRQQTAVRLRLLGLLLAGTATVVWVVELLGGPQLLSA